MRQAAELLEGGAVSTIFAMSIATCSSTATPGPAARMMRARMRRWMPAAMRRGSTREGRVSAGVTV